MTLLQILRLLMPELSETLATVSLYGSIALALLTCFFGYRLRQVWYTLLVFGIAGLIGFSVSVVLLPDRLGLCLLIGLGAGILVSGFTFRLYRAVVFLLAFYCAFGVVGEVLGELHPVLSLIVALVLGIMAGLLAAKFQYHAVILITGVSGGWRAASGFCQCIEKMTPRSMLILASALIAAGILFQFISTRKYTKKR